MGLLERKGVCVVTGGAAHAGGGGKLVLSDLSREALQAVRDGLPDGDVELLTADVSIADDVEVLAAKSVARFGHVDAVLSNAGISAR